MKSFLYAFLLFTLFAAPGAALAANMADVVKAQVVLNKALAIAAKFDRVQPGDVSAPKPRDNARGRYLLPYTKDGMLTAWAAKALNVQVGATVGAKAGEEAGKHLASRVPFGGLASGLMRKKGKEMGAVAALGGKKFIKKTSSMSFDNLDDYAVYLHVTHAGDPNFPQALAAAMAVYPALEQDYDQAIRQAYRRAAQGK